MRNFRRYISSSLATLLIVAAMSSGMQAKTFGDVSSDAPFVQQIGILSDIGVIKGTGTDEFSPDAPVTREQMALFLFRLMLAKESGGHINTSPFSDLYDETYHGAISWANASGYILGTSANTFEPTEGITLQDAMTMLVRALGHSSYQMNAGYPWTYIDAAVKLGLDEGLESLKYTKELTRAEVAALLYNALSAEYLIPRTASNGMTFYESTTIIERVFGYEIAESVIVATNDFALPGLEKVTKDGYVTVRTETGMMTVKYSELGLSGNASEHLGKNMRLVFKKDDKTKLVSILGATELSKTEKPTAITFGKDNSNVDIGGVKYQVVQTLSDSLATNANELLVYAFDADGVLTQITSNADLAALTGAFDAKLIFDNRESEVASRLIIKPFAFGQIKISGGKVNLAGDTKLTDLTLVGPEELMHGDHVLYYYNADSKTLEVKAIIPLSAQGEVTRITADSAVIGGVTYKLGNEKLGITAASIRSQLTIGAKMRVAALNGAILAVDTTVVVNNSASKYLIAESNATPIFTAGRFGFVAEVTIDGKTETIFLADENITPGKVYRYTTDANGVTTLIAPEVTDGVISTGSDKFVQKDEKNDEIAFIIGSADATTLKDNGSHFVLNKGDASASSSAGRGLDSVSFITDGDSMFIIKTSDGYRVVKGKPNTEITISDGANVTAILTNEVGAVETLKLMIVSDGSIGSVNSTEGSVKIIAHAGKELNGGKVMSVYHVLDLATGELQYMLSESDSLTLGKNYLIGVDGHISSAEASITNGTVTGYTRTTITVGGTTYTLASDVSVVALTTDGKVEAVSIADLYEGNVEIIVKDGKVSSIVLIKA